MIETALIECLRRAPPVQELVGDRVFSMFRPEVGPLAALPAVVLQVVNVEPVRSMDGASGLVHGFFDIECYAVAIKTLAALVEGIRLWLDDFRGWVNGTHIKDMRLSGIADVIGPVIAGRSVPTFGRSFDASIWYTERKPIR